MYKHASQIYYFKQNQEVDFYADMTHPQLINVSYDISHPETKRREIEGLYEGMSYFNITQATLITHDHEETIESDGKTVIIKPLWKWLLE